MLSGTVSDSNNADINVTVDGKLICGASTYRQAYPHNTIAIPLKAGSVVGYKYNFGTFTNI